MEKQDEFSTKQYIKNHSFSMDYVLDRFNNRLRVEDFRGNLNCVVKKVGELITKYHFEKAIVKVRQEQFEYFLGQSYILEAVIKGYFNGNDAFVMSRFYEESRRSNSNWKKEDEIIDSIFNKSKSESGKSIPTPFHMRKVKEHDYENLAELYKSVFEIYPTPLNDPSYIKKIVDEGCIFYVIENEDGELVSAASADINYMYHNAEITDCATLPSYRKHGFMKILISALEKELINKHVYCAYSIARSLSYGMNACFFHLNYQYTGRFTNNCYIFDKLEDMNVWVKDLSTNTTA
ncbi:putative beta-lysine N-acetyltransferase [Bacillus timonensis]|nr:putative beta-lysine N-acetyltransferase [Bacillus timonensis]